MRFFALFDDSRTATDPLDPDDPPFQNPQRLGDPQGQVRRRVRDFDLNDPEATTGSWDVYGQESTARYPGQQEEFFEKAAQGLGRREAMYSFLALAGPAACLIFGGKGAKDANLPITVGPQTTPPLGPRDRL